MRITKQKLKQIIKEELDNISYDDTLGVTEPRHDVGQSPHHRLLRKLFMRQKLDQMSPQQIEALAGGDEEVMKLIKDLLSDMLLDNPRM